MNENRGKTRDEKGRVLPGNRLSMKSGAHSYLRTNRVPSIRGKRQIENHLRELRKALVEVVPGADDPRKAILISQVVRAEGFLLLIESYIRRVGVFRADKWRRGIAELQPALASSVISFLNSQRSAVLALGMDMRSTGPELTIAEVIKEFDEAKAGAEKEAQEAEKRAEMPQDRVSSEDLIESAGTSDDVPGGEDDRSLS